MKRTLVLRREHLRDLSAADLAAVAGGQQPSPSKDCPPDYTYHCLITGRLVCGIESDTTLCP